MMNNLGKISVISFAILLLLSLPTSAQVVLLSASSQFNMVLGPVLDALSSIEIRQVENGISTVVGNHISNSGNDFIVNIEGVVQESNFLNAQQLATSQIRFFVLATTTTTTTSAGENSQVELNGFIESSLIDSEAEKNTFVEFLRMSDLLVFSNISFVDVAPVVPAPSRSPPASNDDELDSSRRLSTLDIILIAVSGLIFLGIIYMIVQHHKDQGYIENQRVLVANRPIRDTQTMNEENSTPRSVHIVPKGQDRNTFIGSSETPSTPSTIHSNELNSQPLRLSPPSLRYNPHKPQITAMTSKALLSASSTDGESVKSIGESIDSTWFGTPSIIFDGPSFDTTNKNKRNGDEIYNRKKDGVESLSVASEESDDVFFVDVDTAKTKALQQKQTKLDNNTTISDWMKTIRVVSSPAKTSEMTQSSHDASLAGLSTVLTIPDDSSCLEQRSLEESMASSHPDAPRPRPTIVEV